MAGAGGGRGDGKGDCGRGCNKLVCWRFVFANALSTVRPSKAVEVKVGRL